MKNGQWKMIGLLLALLGTVSCGGDGDGNGNGDGGGAGTTVAGTGMGTITGFGSLILNDDRVFRVEAETEISLDDSPITETELRQKGLGLVTRVEVGEDVNDDFSAGTAKRVHAGNALKGPITGENPLKVLEQAVVITGDTFLANIPGNNIASLGLGDILEVSGYSNGQSGIQATRVEFKAGGVPVWKLTGVVSALVPGLRFNIGNQGVSLVGGTPRDCSGGLSNGDFVEIKANPDAGFSPGAVLDTVTDLECKTQGLGIPDDASGTDLEAEIEGLVTAINSPSDFFVSGQRVQTTAATRFENGSAEDIELSVLLEAEGSLNTTSRILTANKISFRQARVRIEAPAAPEDVEVDQSVTLLGIPVLANAMTDDEDGILSGGLGDDRQVEIRGFVDGDGFVFATRVRDRGVPDINDVRLRGPVSRITNPTFEILDVAVDTASASAILDSNGNPITAAAFFSQIAVGSPVQVEDGTYNELTDTISNGRIELED